MELTRIRHDEWLELRVTGRLDAYWAEQLDAELGELVRSGEHHLRLHLGEVSFLSSAGIRVLLSYAKQLAQINGSFLGVEPSAPVREVLEMSGLGALLATETATSEPVAVTSAGREVIAGAVKFSAEGRAAAAPCRLIGDPRRLEGAAFGEGDCSPLRIRPITMAVGIGALGEDYSDCRGRFGEFLSVAGAVACLPTGSEAAPDYMVGTGAYVPTVSVLYAIACEMGDAVAVSFEPAQAGGEINLSELVEVSLDAAGAPACAVVLLAETRGLVGASLKRSPAEGAVAGAPFEHPAVREWLSFTSEPVKQGSLALVAGVAAREATPALADFVRPVTDNPSPVGHFHAAAFSYRALPTGTVDPAALVCEVFETQSLETVLHLLADLRGLHGTGESTFGRGMMWAAPLDLVDREGEYA